jgi:hypothetical protein
LGDATTDLAEGSRVLVDSGSGYSALPLNLWNELYLEYHPAIDNEGDNIIDCRFVPSIPTIVIKFATPGSTPIHLTGPMQVLIKSGCHCSLIFSPTADHEKMLWGSSFLSNFYTTFDFENQSIHFYESDSQYEKNPCY